MLPEDRQERMHYMRRMFPQNPGEVLGNHWVGGRAEALRRLHDIDAVTFRRNRNFLNGAVTRLSSYLRHGCISLLEVVDHIKSNFGELGDKLVMQLALREYWRQVWYLKGDAILGDMETPKVPIGRHHLAEDIRKGKTGLPCMDGFIRSLLEEGYVHHHARLWLAAYVLHWRKTNWREAADWFEANLLDGDKASNHLSWQWVASLFSSKPYYFDKKSLARHTGEYYCADCKSKCPFDDSLPNLRERLFSDTLSTTPVQYPPVRPVMPIVQGQSAFSVLVHDEMLSPAHILLRRPFTKLFVFDDKMYGKWSIHRLQFIADCLSEMPSVEVWVGDLREVLAHRDIGRIESQDTPNQELKNVLAAYDPVWHPEDKFVDVEVSSKRLKRFSRYWDKVGSHVLAKIGAVPSADKEHSLRNSEMSA
jgi:deoxyribodipyrimidine photo-lyase